MLRSASRHYRLSALLAQRAASEAQKASSRGLAGVAGVVASHQAAQAEMSQAAVVEMLAEQGTPVDTQHRINVLAFTTSRDLLGRMLDSAGNARLGRLVESLVQSSGRTAEFVSSATRHVNHVRYLSPPSCSRCAVLAGRVYSHSEGFQRHPNCDCVMIPVTVAADDLIQDPRELMNQGLVTGLSKADQRAINDGADPSKVVNVRRKSAGVTESGRVLTRGRRHLTPEGIYRKAKTDEEAIGLLRTFGYIT